MRMMEASFLLMEDEYIDIELASSSSSSSSSLNIFSSSINSPPQSRDFEFQVVSVSRETESTTSPADQLFYKGKLLPLHLPPRLLMLENILQSPEPTHEQVLSSSAVVFEETYLLPLIATTDSSSVSSVDSCSVSFDLNPDEYHFEWKAEETFWFRKLNEIKKSVLGQKLRATRDYLKSLFRKTARSTERKCLCQAMEIMEEEIFKHRKSFAGVIQRVSPSSTSSSSSSASSSSFSFSSNGFSDLQLLTRCSSANEEVERSIEGAIAYCKQSQRLFWSSKMESGAGTF